MTFFPAWQQWFSPLFYSSLCSLWKLYSGPVYDSSFLLYLIRLFLKTLAALWSQTKMRLQGVTNLVCAHNEMRECSYGEDAVLRNVAWVGCMYCGMFQSLTAHLVIATISKSYSLLSMLYCWCCTHAWHFLVDDIGHDADVAKLIFLSRCLLLLNHLPFPHLIAQPLSEAFWFSLKI